jgi:NTE family protein
MLEVCEIPLFSQLPRADLRAIEGAVRIVEFPPGSALCRKGEPGRQLFAIASGGVRVMFGDDRGAFLGPGQIIGELSLLADMPVSASVFAVKPTRAFALDRDDFLGLLDTSPVLHRLLAELLVDRLREGPAERSFEGARCIVILLPHGLAAAVPLARALHQRIAGYCPEAQYMELYDGAEIGSGPRLPAPDRYPPVLAPAPQAGAAAGPLLDRAAVRAADVVADWRADSVTGQHLVLVARAGDAAALRPALRNGDAVLPVLAPGCEHPLGAIPDGATFGGADVREVCMQPGARAPAAACGQRWCQRLDLPPDGLAAGGEIDAALTAELDMLARWAVHRGIGIAMGAGAARGFAHLGVLKVLEEAGLPLDYFTGTSIGGIVALIYAYAGSADEAIRLSRDWLGAEDRVLDRFKTFRAALYPGAKIRHAAHSVFGGACIETLRRPVAAVAADLVTGDKVVMDHGPAAEAALATSAIPGFFPPLLSNGRILIDGAPVSRVPVDLLERQRCRLKLAVNVVPRPLGDEAALQETRDRIFSFFGFSQVWLRSWEVQAYWDGVKETSHADILLEPDTRGAGAFEFGRVDELIELGIRSASEKLDSIEAAFKMALSADSL